MNLEVTISGLAWFLILAGSVYATWRVLKPRNYHSMRSVVIVVLGDIGRSPRMMYHAQCFAETNFVTHLVGYGGSKPIPALERLPRVQIHYLPEPPAILKSLPFVLLAPLKIAHQILSILYISILEIEKPPEFILVQNPPTIPTLALAWLIGTIRGSKVIIDWHNLGYSILALKLGENHLFVKIAKWFEKTFGRTAYAHLFVTKAMKESLVKEWDLQGQHKLVFHDRPPSHFHRSSPQETHELFLSLQAKLIANPALKDFLPPSNAPYSTPFTHTASSPVAAHFPSPFSGASGIQGVPAQTSPPVHSAEQRARIGSPAPGAVTGHGSGTGASTAPKKPVLATGHVYEEIRMPTLRSDRPALVVSSTSWTADEDFGKLLAAMGMYENKAREVNGGEGSDEDGEWMHASKDFGSSQKLKKRLPKMLVVVTGKGPMRDSYMKEIERLQKGWKYVRCVSLWLEAEQYPILLGSADIGVSLHESSSNMDLPMKVVDMFGCKLPVCALDFDCLAELVKDGVNGVTFKTASQLANHFESLLSTFPSTPRLDQLRSSLKKSTKAYHRYRPSSASMSKHGGDSLDWANAPTFADNWAQIVRPLVLGELDHIH